MKSLLLVLLLPLTLIPAFGQKTKKSPFLLNPQKETTGIVKFNAGIKAGVVVNKLSANLNDYVSRNYVGFKGGLFGKINIKKWYVQPEVNFAMNGGTIYNPENNSNYTLRVNTIEVPLLAGYDLLDLKIFRLRLNLGPYVSFNVSQKITGDSPYRAEDLRKTNAGILAGGGIDIWKIGLDFRYQFGLTNMIRNNPMFQDPLKSARNGVFEISASYRF